MPKSGLEVHAALNGLGLQFGGARFPKPNRNKLHTLSSMWLSLWLKTISHLKNRMDIRGKRDTLSARQPS